MSQPESPGLPAALRIGGKRKGSNAIPGTHLLEVWREVSLDMPYLLSGSEKPHRGLCWASCSLETVKKSYCDPLPGCNHETEVCHSGILKGFQAVGSPAETHMGHIIPRSRQQVKLVKRKAPSAPAMNLSAFPLTQQCSSNSAGEF